MTDYDYVKNTIKLSPKQIDKVVKFKNENREFIKLPDLAPVLFSVEFKFSTISTAIIVKVGDKAEHIGEVLDEDLWNTSAEDD